MSTADELKEKMARLRALMWKESKEHGMHSPLYLAMDDKLMDLRDRLSEMVGEPADGHDHTGMGAP